MFKNMKQKNEHFFIHPSIYLFIYHSIFVEFFIAGNLKELTFSLWIVRADFLESCAHMLSLVALEMYWHVLRFLPFSLLELIWCISFKFIGSKFISFLLTLRFSTRGRVWELSNSVSYGLPWVVRTWKIESEGQSFSSDPTQSDG